MYSKLIKFTTIENLVLSYLKTYKLLVVLCEVLAKKLKNRF